MYSIDIIALNWGIAIVIFFFIVWIIMAKKLLKTEPKEIKVNLADRYDDISADKLKKFEIDSNDFKKMVYEKFTLIHNALSKYDYETLKKNLTNDLYQYYVSQLEILKQIKRKNFMNNFELLDIKIYNVSNEHDLLRIDVYLNVRMLDYVVDIDTNECINGSNSDKIDYEFELRFEKRGNGNSIKKQFVMSKKTCINDMVSKIDKMENS